MTLVTEKEAAEKLCPMTAPSWPWVKCIGSKCMAWRWDGRMDISAIKAIRDERGLSLHEAVHEYRKSFANNKTELGFCGAFGKVEP